MRVRLYPILNHLDLSTYLKKASTPRASIEPLKSDNINQMSITAVRGAISIPGSNEEHSQMMKSVGDLVSLLCKLNRISIRRIISVQLTQTSDLVKKNAASALREAIPKFNQVPLFCSQEPMIEDSLPRTVRILITWRTWRGRKMATPVYLGAAQSLRF